MATPEETAKHDRQLAALSQALSPTARDQLLGLVTMLPVVLSGEFAPEALAGLVLSMPKSIMQEFYQHLERLAKATIDV